MKQIEENNKTKQDSVGGVGYDYELSDILTFYILYSFYTWIIKW